MRVFPVPVAAKVTLWPEIGLSFASLSVAVTVTAELPSAVIFELVESVIVE